MNENLHPIVIYQVPNQEEIVQALYADAGLAAWAQTIIASLQNDGLNFVVEDDIIEVPVREEEGG